MPWSLKIYLTWSIKIRSFFSPFFSFRASFRERRQYAFNRSMSLNILFYADRGEKKKSTSMAEKKVIYMRILTVSDV